MLSSLLAISLMVTTLGLHPRVASASLFFEGEESADIFPSQSDLPITTCDQCTLYSGYVWCPIDFSCHNNVSTCGSHCTQQAHKHPSVAALYTPSAGADEGTYCVDVQFCFYGANKCSDCVFGGGTWCPQKRRCFMFNSRPQRNQSSQEVSNLNDKIGRKFEEEGGTIYSSLVCQESCVDDKGDAGQCIPTDHGCPDCEQFHPSIGCSSLLPVLILSSLGSATLGVAITYAGLVIFRRLRAEHFKRQVEKTRLLNRKMARARAKAKKRQQQQDAIKQEQEDELAGNSEVDRSNSDYEGNTNQLVADSAATSQAGAAERASSFANEEVSIQ